MPEIVDKERYRNIYLAVNDTVMLPCSVRHRMQGAQIFEKERSCANERERKEKVLFGLPEDNRPSSGDQPSKVRYEIL